MLGINNKLMIHKKNKAHNVSKMTNDNNKSTMKSHKKNLFHFFQINHREYNHRFKIPRH